MNDEEFTKIRREIEAMSDDEKVAKFNLGKKVDTRVFSWTAPSIFPPRRRWGCDIMLEQVRRFAAAQDAPACILRAEGRSSFDVAREELELGAKHSHWMWWTFPQFLPNKSLNELSDKTKTYAIKDTEEAHMYLNTPLLYNRYHALTLIVLRHLERRTVAPIVLMGSEIDCKKLVSSLTLFAAVGLRTARAELARDALGVLHLMDNAGFPMCQYTMQKFDFSHT